MKSIPDMWKPEQVDELRLIKETLKKRGIDIPTSGILKQLLAHGVGSEFWNFWVSQYPASEIK